MNPRILDDHRIDDDAIRHESTYALLVRSEEKPRTLLEVILYFLFVFSAIAAIWQFASQPIALPLDSVTTLANATHATSKPTLCPPHVHG